MSFFERQHYIYAKPWKAKAISLKSKEIENIELKYDVTRLDKLVYYSISICQKFVVFVLPIGLSSYLYLTKDESFVYFTSGLSLGYCLVYIIFGL